MVYRTLRRFLLSLLTLYIVLTATFFIIQLAPGDPANLFFTPGLPEDFKAQLRKVYHLDRPLGERYILWLKDLTTGNLGISTYHHRPVGELLKETLPNTLLLGIFALWIDLFIGIAWGIYQAKHLRSFSDKALSTLSLALFSTPHFWLALMALLFFAHKFPLFPPGGMHSLGYQTLPYPWKVWDLGKHLFLPAFLLGIQGASVTSRFVREKLEEGMKQPFYRTCLAKGLPQRRIFRIHTLPHALLPIITLVGLNLPFLVSGSLITEVIFSWPGMGRLAYQAIFTRDYPLILGATLLSAGMVILGNLLADLAYTWVDPRIRHVD